MITNTTYVTKEDLQTFTIRLLKLNSLKKILTLCILILVISVAALIVGISIDVLELIIISALLLVLDIIYLCFPLITKNIVGKQFDKTSKGESHLKIDFTFSNDNFAVTEKTGKWEGEYNNIREIIDSEDAIYIMISKEIGYILKKNNFNTGDINQLFDIFALKGIKLRTIKN